MMRAVVVSSGWRVRRPLKQLADILEAAGVLPGRVVGKTPWLDCERGLEIDAWLKGAPFPVASFVILDDMADMWRCTRSDWCAQRRCMGCGWGTPTRRWRFWIALGTGRAESGGWQGLSLDRRAG